MSSCCQKDFHIDVDMLILGDGQIANKEELFSAVLRNWQGFRNPEHDT